MRVLKCLIPAVFLMFVAAPVSADGYRKITEIKMFHEYGNVYFGDMTHHCKIEEHLKRFLFHRSNTYMYTLLIGAFENDWGVNISWTCQDIPSQGGNVPVITGVRVAK